VNRVSLALIALSAVCITGNAQAQDGSFSLESTNIIGRTHSWGKILLDSGEFRYIPVDNIYENPSTRGTIIVQPRTETGREYFVDAYTSHFSCNSQKVIASDVNTYNLQTLNHEANIITMDFQPVIDGTFFADVFNYYCNGAPLNFAYVLDDFEAVRQDALKHLSTPQ
jgi:hypothetical protein